MAQRELALQTKIIQSIRKDGGHARKMSHRFAIGIPDLLIGMPPYVPCLAEVKDLGIVTANFNLQLDVTEKQALELRRVSEPYEDMFLHTRACRTGMLLIGLVHMGEHRLVGLPRSQGRLDAGYEADPLCWVKRQQAGYYEILPLLKAGGIAKVSL